VLDEPVSALDVSDSSADSQLLRDIQKRPGRRLSLHRHDLAAVAHMSHTIAVMYLGKIVESGAAAEVALAPQHPYTRALFAAALPIDLDRPREEITLAGEVPSRWRPRTAAAFTRAAHRPCPAAPPRSPGSRSSAAGWSPAIFSIRAPGGFD